MGIYLVLFLSLNWRPFPKKGAFLITGVEEKKKKILNCHLRRESFNLTKQPHRYAGLNSQPPFVRALSKQATPGTLYCL